MSTQPTAENDAPRCLSTLTIPSTGQVYACTVPGRNHYGDHAWRLASENGTRLPRCVRCGAQTIYDAQAGRYVHEDPAVSLAVDHAAHVIPPGSGDTYPEGDAS